MFCTDIYELFRMSWEDIKQPSWKTPCTVAKMVIDSHNGWSWVISNCSLLLRLWQQYTVGYNSSWGKACSVLNCLRNSFILFVSTDHSTDCSCWLLLYFSFPPVVTVVHYSILRPVNKWASGPAVTAICIWHIFLHFPVDLQAGACWQP